MTYKHSCSVSTGNMFSNLCSILKKLEVLGLLFSVLIFGMFTGVIGVFLFWHLRLLGAIQVNLGLCMLRNCLLEIPVLFLGGKIVNRVGHIPCLYLAYLAYIARFLGYSFLLNPWFALLIEPLHSITFGVMYCAASSYGSLITPQGMHGTIQGLIGAVHFGFGKGKGSVVGGQVFQKYGGAITFLGCAGLSGVGLICYVILNLATCSWRKKPESVIEKDNTGANEAANEMLDKDGKIDKKSQKNNTKLPHSKSLLNGSSTA